MNDHNPQTNGVRASDAERAAVTERLSAHAAAGRLSVDELGARLEAAGAAVFAHDLDALERDLPGPASAGTPRRSGPPRRLGPPLLLLPVLAVALVGSVAVGHPVFLPVLAFFLFATLARRSWA
jgi:Domain of unknown function (DUF1707)